MRNPFKRWRLVKDDLEVVGLPDNRGAATDAANVLLRVDDRPDRDDTQRPAVRALEGDEWTVHAAGGMVYLSGEDGLVQAQFSPLDAMWLAQSISKAANDAMRSSEPS